MRSFLFICTGNTCRSPMAAAVMCQKKLPVTVKCAGICADGSSYSQNSIAVMAEIGIDIRNGKSVLLDGGMLQDVTDIFCMSKSHKDILCSAGVPKDTITVLGVCDPFGGDMDVYRRCRDEIIQKLTRFDFTVREYKDCDSAGIAAVEAKSFSAPWTQEAICQSAESGVNFFVAVNGDNEICGYCGVQCILDEAYVTNIAVLPEYRQLGLCTKLLQKMTEHCQKIGSSFLSLEVRKSNSVAIDIYEKSGFTVAGTRKNFYTLPCEDALIMTRMMKDENTGD